MVDDYQSGWRIGCRASPANYNLKNLVAHATELCYTDKKADLIKLGEFIGRLKNLKGLDVLPYHTMGVNKYKEMGISYPLKGMEALPMEKAVEAKKYILEGVKKTRL